MSVDVAPAFVTEHEELSAGVGAAAHVMRLADDVDASAQQLARAVAPDPVLAARVLRVANSAYYGLGGRVSTLPFAVSLVGFQTVRSLAVAAAAGLDRPDAVPEGFWEAAALSASAAELVAPLLGAQPGDAFSIGLLHTLGAALLHQHSPLAALCLPERLDGQLLSRQEQETYGITHAAAGARVLAAWHLPQGLWLPIARHHEALLPDAPPLERTLHVARALTGRALSQTVTGLSTDDGIAWLSQGRVTAPDLDLLLVRIKERADGLLEGLRPR